MRQNFIEGIYCNQEIISFLMAMKLRENICHTCLIHSPVPFFTFWLPDHWMLLIALRILLPSINILRKFSSFQGTSLSRLTIKPCYWWIKQTCLVILGLKPSSLKAQGEATRNPQCMILVTYKFQFISIKRIAYIILLLTV